MHIMAEQSKSNDKNVAANAAPEFPAQRCDLHLRMQHKSLRPEKLRDVEEDKAVEKYAWYWLMAGDVDQYQQQYRAGVVDHLTACQIR